MLSSAATPARAGDRSSCSTDFSRVYVYLNVLSTNCADPGFGLAVAPTSAWRSLASGKAGVRVPSQPGLIVTP